MLSNRLAFVLLAAACISAAAGGGYLATRQNAVPVPASAEGKSSVAPVAPGPIPAAAPGTPLTAERPVQETEAIVGDSRPKPAPARPMRDVTPRVAAREAHPPSSKPRAEQTPAFASTWPSSAAQQQPPAPLTPEAPPAARPAENPDRTITEPARVPEPPRPTYEELVVSRDSVLGLETESRIS